MIIALNSENPYKTPSTEVGDKGAVSRRPFLPSGRMETRAFRKYAIQGFIYFGIATAAAVVLDNNQQQELITNNLPTSCDVISSNASSIGSKKSMVLSCTVI